MKMTRKTTFNTKFFQDAFGFGRALARLKDGFLVRRATWPEGVWLELDEKVIYVANGVPNGALGTTEIHRNLWDSSSQDLMANDWAVLDVQSMPLKA